MYICVCLSRKCAADCRWSSASFCLNVYVYINVCMHMYVCEYICIHVYVCLGNATLDVLLIPQQSLIIHIRLFVFSCLCMYTIRTHSIRNRCKFTTHTWLPNLPHTRYWVSDHLNDLNSWDWDDELTEMTRCNCIQQQHSDNTIQIYNIETTILRSTTLRQQHWDLIASNEHIQICMAPCVDET